MGDRLRIVPMRRDPAYAVIAAWHRHHKPPTGYQFALGCALGDRVVGVAVAGRPVSKEFDDGVTIEVTRVATDGTQNANSMLYGACWRAARALGYSRALTYTEDGESGASLRAAGWLHAATRPARAGWDTRSRPRSDDGYRSVDRLLWVILAAERVQLPTVWPVRPAEDVLPLLEVAGA